MDKSAIITAIIDHYFSGNKAEFSRFMGVSPQTVNNWIVRGTFDPFIINDKFNDISPAWLLTGEGPMQKSQEQSYHSNTVGELKPLYTPRRHEPTIREQYVPYYSFEATAGVLEHLDKSPEYEIGKIMVPNMPKCDGAVSVTGDSMYPLLKSGDIIAYQIIHDINNIHYGDMYLIGINEDGDTYITVKWVTKHPTDPSKAILISNNEHYAPRVVEFRHVSRMALIKFSIRYNNMG